MIRRLRTEDAVRLFEQLPESLQITTLSPAYVLADSARSAELEPVFVAYREQDSFWLHGLHCSRVPGEAVFDLQSAYGYGGPVANNEDQDFIARAWSAYARWCAESKVIAEFIRFHPLAANWRFYGGEVRDDRNTVAVPLQTNVDLLRGYSVRARTAVRKAQVLGVTAAWLSFTEHVATFGKFYRSSMTSIGADQFYMFDDHYFSELAKVTDVGLLVCYLDSEWVSAGLFLHGRKTLEYHLSATSAKGRRLGATNLLIHEAALHGQSRCCEWLYLGGGTDNSEKNSLLFFKRSFAERMFPFRVGFTIHDPEMYRRLQQAHTGQQKPSARVLFYR